MKMILETVDDENYLEFVLMENEIESLSSSTKIISMIGEIGDSIYQIGIRNMIPEEFFEQKKRKRRKMPLIKSSKPEDVHANISEMVKAGHPKDQAVAAALNVAREAKKNQKKERKR